MSSNLTGGSGNDILTGTDNGITIEGNDGNDTITGGSGDDVIIGGKGADVINAGDGNNSIYGFLKNDQYGSYATESWDGQQDSITAGEGNDRILSIGNNTINAGDGDNYIFEGGGGYLSLDFTSNSHNQLGWFPDPIVPETASGPWYFGLFFGSDGLNNLPDITTGNGSDKVFIGQAKNLNLGSGDDYLWIADTNNRDDIISYSGEEGYDRLFIKTDSGDTVSRTPVSFDKESEILTSLYPEDSYEENIYKYDIDFSKIKGFEELIICSQDLSQRNTLFDLGDYISAENKISKIIYTSTQTSYPQKLIVDASDYKDNEIEFLGLPPTDQVGNDTIFFGGDGNDKFTGGHAINEVYGGKGNDEMIGNIRDDIFKGEEGDDTLNGVSGTDTAIYSGNFSDYEITRKTYNSFYVKDLRTSNNEGTDTVIEIDTLQFQDQNHSLETLGNNGTSSFEITGVNKVGESLSCIESSVDPDGNGSFSYVWESFEITSESWSIDDSGCTLVDTDGIWTPIGTESTYLLTSNEEGEDIRVSISYEDGLGFSETSYALLNEKVPLFNNGQASFTIQETPIIGQYLSIGNRTSSDPDGHIKKECGGTVNIEHFYSWESSSDEITWTKIGSDSTYLVDLSDENKKIRAIISYTDTQGFNESVTTESVFVSNRDIAISFNTNTPQEGYLFSADITMSESFRYQKVYWEVTGTGINKYDFSSASSDQIRGDGTGSFSLSDIVAIDGEVEGNEKGSLKIYSDSGYTNLIAEKSFEITESSVTQQIAEIRKDSQNNTEIISQLTKNQEYLLEYVRDFDGNLHANSGSVSDTAKKSYKYQGLLDVNADGTTEAIYTNKVTGRWVTASINSETGEVDFSKYGDGGTTRVVGIYKDPLIEEGENNNGFLADGVTPAPANFGVSEEQRFVEVNGETIDRLALNSQVRFQNDLEIDNLQVKNSGDYDSNGINEVYWKTSDGTAYLRALMHDDGNIRYANYQSEDQMKEYLTSNGYESTITEITS